MAVKVNKEQMANNVDGDFTPETKVVPAGDEPAVMVSYVELGKHYPMFKGSRARYDQGKRIGQLKDAELVVHIAFEFPEAEYDNVPLTIETSIPYGNNGEFINKLSVVDALADGKLSLSIANRTAYMKYLNAMNEATGEDREGLHEHIGSKFLINVTHNTGKPDKDGNSKVYANMKPDGITKPSFRHPRTKVVEEVPVPDPVGTYGPIFDWDNPTEEAWNALKKNFKECIKKAVNYEGSPVQAMLANMPDQNDDAIPAGEEMPDNLPPKHTGKAAEAEDDGLPA